MKVLNRTTGNNCIISIYFIPEKEKQDIYEIRE